MGELRVYATVARLAFRRQATYRAAMLAALFTNVVFGFIIASLFRAVVAERGSVGGWDAKDLVTFAFATQSLLGAVAAFGERELGMRVVTGDIATDFVRPVSIEGWTVAQFFGKFAGAGGHNIDILRRSRLADVCVYRLRTEQNRIVTPLQKFKNGFLNL